MHVAVFQASPTWSNKQAGNSPQKSFQHPFKSALTPCTPASIKQPNPIRMQHQIGKLFQAQVTDSLCGFLAPFPQREMKEAAGSSPMARAGAAQWMWLPAFMQEQHPPQPQVHAQGCTPAPEQVKQGCSSGWGVGFLL